MCRCHHLRTGYWGRHAKIVFLSLAALCLFVLSANPQQNRPTVTLNAVGDILLTRGIGRKIAAHGEQYPFQSIASTLRRADIVIGNLECALSDRPFVTRQQFRFRASPARAKLLSEAGITMVNLANNHSADCGPEGLSDTFSALEDAGVKWCGLSGEPDQVAIEIQEVHGLRFALLGFSDFLPADGSEREAGVSYASDERVAAAVRKARTMADAVIVSFHWGLEQQSRPCPRQRHLARIAAAAGADLILGHHPHVLEGFEVMNSGVKGRKTLVAYSLGSFLFDGHKAAEKQGLILRCSLGKGGVRSAEIVPVQIEHSAPRPATAREAAATLSHIRALSAELGARMAGSRFRILASAN